MAVVFTSLTVGGWTRWSASLFAVGVITYTFAEYVYHRWVAHGLMYDVSEGHHDMEDQPFAAPWFLIPVVVYIVYSLTGTAFTAGVIWCHVWQEGVHWHAHNTSSISTLRWHHLAHHTRTAFNFGLSTTFWDRVFKTQWRVW